MLNHLLSFAAKIILFIHSCKFYHVFLLICGSLLLWIIVTISRCKDSNYDPMTEEKKHEVLSLFHHVLYNDSVVFESFGGYPGMRGFPDRDHFLATYECKEDTSGAVGQ